MLNTVRKNWNDAKERKIFWWFAVILVVALYCNLGWALGYAVYHPESIPHWLHFLADPLLTDGIAGDYDRGHQIFCSILGPIYWFGDWLVYLLSLCVGGIAKLLIMP